MQLLPASEGKKSILRLPENKMSCYEGVAILLPLLIM